MKASDLQDPRFQNDFRSDLFPLCDDRPPPDSRTTDRVEKRILRFAIIYYHLNVCYERLQQARWDGTDEGVGAMIDALDEVVHFRDSFEDQLAPEGFYAEPELEGLIAVNLKISHAFKRKSQPAQAQTSSSFRLVIPIPPPGADVEDHLRKHLGEILKGVDEIGKD